MFAVIKTGGKQYRVATDDLIVVERLQAEAGDTFVFGEVLMLGDGDKVHLGEKEVASAQVVGEIVEQRRGAKVIIFKKKQRNTYRRKKGHKQHETVVKITEILAKGGRSEGVAKGAKPAKAAATESKPKAAKPAKPAKEAAAPAPAATATAAAAVDARGRMSAPIGAADDLKKINGVGKVLEKKLNDAGVFYFWQIAALTSEQVEELEKDMSFPGRITRDNWIEQAETLAKAAKGD
ncbi:50S ribosomal protein L21 [bacterium]|nr:50S ribosomal protein L21 [bacterium]